MKSKLLTMAAICGFAFAATAQTKGTNTLGLGVSVMDSKIQNENNQSSNKVTSFSLGYGHFVADNKRIGFELMYGNSEYMNNNQGQTFKNYGANVSFQNYYPLIKTLYAYAGGLAGYQQSNEEGSYNSQSESITRNYSVGARGGLTWFVSKRFAFEADLLSANVSYSKTSYSYLSAYELQKNSSTNFNLSTKGFIDDLGFKIYLLF